MCLQEPIYLCLLNVQVAKVGLSELHSPYVVGLCYVTDKNILWMWVIWAFSVVDLWINYLLFIYNGVFFCLFFKVLGHKEGLNVMERADPLFLLIGLPTIPVMLILGKMVRWEDYVLRLWRKHSAKLPLVNYLWPDGNTIHATLHYGPPALCQHVCVYVCVLCICVCVCMCVCICVFQRNSLFKTCLSTVL